MKFVELKGCRLVQHLIKDIDNNAGWLCFFLMFSRFEYALKRSGYAKMNSHNNLEIEWGRLGQEVKETFATYDSDELKEAKLYLLSKETSPKKQIKNSATNNLDYLPVESTEDEIHRLIYAVKRVRNNLFHGGKFPDPTGPVEDPTRNPKLIRHSITILKYLLDSSPEVARLYKEPLEQE